MLKSLCLAVAALLGVVSVLNGVFMLVSPENWYFAVPGVTTTGPFNQHFIRDIGLIFVLVGVAFIIGTVQAQTRLFLWVSATAFLLGHALFHFWEIAVGICEPSVIARDFPAVTLPAILGTLLVIWAIYDQRAAHTASSEGSPRTAARAFP